MTHADMRNARANSARKKMGLVWRGKKDGEKKRKRERERERRGKEKQKEGDRERDEVSWVE